MAAVDALVALAAESGDGALRALVDVLVQMDRGHLVRVTTFALTELASWRST